MNERKVAGANYIISFFNEVQQLNQFYSLYHNLILQLKTKYGKDNLEELEDIDNQQLHNAGQNVRHYCNKVYILYYAIASKANLNLNKIEALYNAAVNDYVIKLDNLKKYVLEINKELVNDIIQDLLRTSHDLINDIYGNSENTTQSD